MKVLLVGLGLVGQRHARNLKQLDPSIELACWRQRPDGPGWTPPAGLPVDRWFYSRGDGMVIPEIECWQPDAAILANPASLHVDNAGWLGHDLGCDLFIEKPLSDSMDWVDQMLEDTAGRVVMVGYDLRHFQPLLKVREALKAGRIGRPLHVRCEVGQYLPDWRPGRDYRTSVSAQASLGGGVLLELSHEFDYARWLMGEVTAVSAMTGRLSDLEIDVEDTADVLLRFASGAQGSIHLDMTDRVGHRSCWVTGTEGSIKCDIQTGQTDLFAMGEARSAKSAILLPDEPKGRHLRWECLHEGLTVIPDPMLEEMRHFLACCRGEAVPPVDGHEGKRVLEVVLAARRSAEERREIDL